MFRKLVFPFFLCPAIACSDPFTVDRHDLVAPRIVSVRLVNNVYEVQVWNGVSIYHEVSPTVEWFDDSGEVVCTGVRCVPSETVPRTVRYTDTDGQIHDAMFDLQQVDWTLTPVWSSLPEDMGLELDSRVQTDGTLVETGLGSPAMRVSMTIEDSNPDGMDTSKMRWMTAGGSGTFLELSALEADFFRADIIMDRDELIANVPQNHVHASVLGLHVDGAGHNQWTWMDVWYESTLLISHQNRWIAISELPDGWTSGEVLSATLSWDPVALDWLLKDPEVTTEIPNSPECTGSTGIPFEWSALELGLCTIDDVDGVRIALETD